MEATSSTAVADSLFVTFQTALVVTSYQPVVFAIVEVCASLLDVLQPFNECTLGNDDK